MVGLVELERRRQVLEKEMMTWKWGYKGEEVVYTACGFLPDIIGWELCHSRG